jgi:CheY-like chemotaxis protein
VKLLILVVDDEPDVEMLFRQHFRRDLRAGRFSMEFAQSASAALQSISDASDASLILILSDINMPGMSGLERPMVTPRPSRRHWRAGPMRCSPSRSIL